MSRRLSTTPTRGFTLIEVVLAIALSAVLLSLLTLAVNQYLLNVQSSRETVEHAQVARGVIRMIADDLRNAAARYEQDTSAVEALAAAAAASSFDAGSIDRESDEVDDNAPPVERLPLGVSGDQATLQIDVARTRREGVAQPEAIAAAGAVPVFVGPPNVSGVSTVRYSLGPQGGLVRQEIAREVALHDDQLGVTTNWEAASRVVAEEVTAIEFQYSDGVQALAAWDLEAAEGANPLAVEVAVTLREPDRRDDQDDPQAARTRRYRVTVGLPAVNAGQSVGSGAGDPLGGAGAASGVGSSSSGSSSR